MSIWPMMDELKSRGGTYDVPYGNTFRLTLGDIWCQYSYDDEEILIGSFVDRNLTLATVETLDDRSPYEAAAFLVAFARDHHAAKKTIVTVRIRWDNHEDN